ncbi:hypothetical protein B0H13DRAFT_1073045 [Mycena leptocephala]|nr:hypothetical protein B0H13DRAFT_1073045 [Mycena leptocephala]
MRFSTFSVMVTAATVAIASPTSFKRNVNCAAVDDDGSALTGSSADSTNSFATCIYKDAGECTYFFSDGSFSSGSSTCPQGLPQVAASSNSDSSASNSASNGAISSTITCPPVDKDGTPLTASSSFNEDGNEFAQCTYKDAGPCAFFFADGSFSSGSSTCPKGLPQTGSAGGGTTTTTPAPPPPPPPTTTQAPPPPPTTTQAAPPPPPPPVTTSAALPPPPPPPPTTSTSTLFSTVAPAPPPTTAPVVPPPAPTTANTDDGFTTVFTSVTVQPSAAATDGVANANSGLGDGSSNGAMGRGAGSAGVVLPLAFVLFALL